MEPTLIKYIKVMKKNYIKPTTKSVILNLNHLMAGSIKPGQGEGTHDANSKKSYFEYDYEEE